MGLDPNIILSGQAPQFQNPLDTMQKIATMKNLAQQGQLQGLQLDAAQRQASDDKAMRAAYQNNVVTGPDGTQSLNKAGVMSDLMKANPVEALKVQQQQRQVDLDNLTKQTAAAKGLAWSIPTDAQTPIEIKQSKWAAARQQGISLGLPNSDKLPEQYPGDDIVSHMQMSTLTAEDQLKQQKDQREYDLKAQHEKTYEKDVDAKRAQNANAKQSQALQQTVQLLESARGNPAVAQAQKDIYAADKADSLVNLYGDPNKLSMPQVRLLAGEVGKIAQGGAPAMHELDGLTPNTLVGRMSETYGNLVNNPTPASAAAFVKQYQDYTGALKKDAQKVVSDKFNRVIDAQRGRVGEANHQMLKSQYVDPLMDKSNSNSAHPQDSAAVEWAKSNPSDPRAAAILKVNGVGQ